MHDSEFLEWLTDKLGSLPGVVAVALGGSRGRGEEQPDSDWDLAIYYRRAFDPQVLRVKGWQGWVGDVGCWGGLMNGGAILTIDGRSVDIHYRDLNEVEHWCREAETGRFAKQPMLFYLAGLPTYVAMAELALNRVLKGELPRPAYPEALSKEAAWRWQEDAVLSLAYAETALRRRGDIALALGNTARGILEASHSRFAAQRRWVVNEKALAEQAGLATEAASLVAATDVGELLDTIRSIQQSVTSPAEH